MDKLIKKLKIDETFTKKTKKPKFDSVKMNTYPKRGYNYMMDILFLPKTSAGFKYLLVVTDIWSDNFDMEPMKDKKPVTVLNAFKKMWRRKYIKRPKASIKVDAGGEFKGVFKKYMYKNNILLRVAESGRHKQLANVENLNRTLGRLFNGYMNRIEIETGEPYKEWTDILRIIRKDLNKIRQKEDMDIMEYTKMINNINIPYKEPKYTVGDIVYRKSEYPLNALGQRQPTNIFRVGDYRWWHKKPVKIINILHYPNNIRYILEGLEHVSYTEDELKKV